MGFNVSFFLLKNLSLPEPGVQVLFSDWPRVSYVMFSAKIFANYQGIKVEVGWALHSYLNVTCKCKFG